MLTSEAGQWSDGSGANPRCSSYYVSQKCPQLTYYSPSLFLFKCLCILAFCSFLWSFLLQGEQQKKLLGSLLASQLPSVLLRVSYLWLSSTPSWARASVCLGFQLYIVPFSQHLYSDFKAMLLWHLQYLRKQWNKEIGVDILCCMTAFVPILPLCFLLSLNENTSQCKWDNDLVPSRYVKSCKV